MATAIIQRSPGRIGAERLLIIAFGAMALLIHFLTNGRYGYFRDELYYIACGQHLALGNFSSMNAFEPLFWMGCIYFLVRIINGGPPKLWLWFGLLAGLGLENKHSMAFFGAGIFVGLLLTPERRHFREKWIWLGGLVAFAIALPNILWQAQHHWPTYELLSNIAHSNKNVVLSPVQFVLQQITLVNPATLPLWLGGLIWMFGSREGRRY